MSKFTAKDVSTKPYSGMLHCLTIMLLVFLVWLNLRIAFDI